MIKLIISDLDGTLLHAKDSYSSHEIVAENIEAVQSLKQQGIDFAIATARGSGFKSEVERQLQTKVHYVGNNGAEIVDKDDNLIAEKMFGYEQLQEVIELIAQLDENCNLLTQDADGTLYMLYADRYPFVSNNPLIRDRSFCDSRTLISEAKALENSKFWRLTILLEPESKLRIKEKLEMSIKGRYHVFSSDVDFLEIADPFVNKGHGVLALAEHLGLNIDEIAVIGDEENDLSMFAITNNSYCMDHSKPHVQQKANHIVKSVAEMIENLVK